MHWRMMLRRWFPKEKRGVRSLVMTGGGAIQSTTSHDRPIAVPMRLVAMTSRRPTRLRLRLRRPRRHPQLRRRLPRGLVKRRMRRKEKTARPRERFTAATITVVWAPHVLSLLSKASRRRNRDRIYRRQCLRRYQAHFLFLPSRWSTSQAMRMRSRRKPSVRRLRCRFTGMPRTSSRTIHCRL